MRRTPSPTCALLLALTAGLTAPLAAQAPDLWVRVGGRESETLNVVDRQGFAAFDATELARFGWPVERVRDTVVVDFDGAEARLAVGTPFFRWEQDVLQLTDAPYVERGQIWVPVQLLIDFVPERLAGLEFDPATRTLFELPTVMAAPLPPVRTRASRVVVIDPGHGGRDPGAIGSGGVREKDVAMGIARALVRLLQADSTLEVHLTRDRDMQVPLWRRGEMATLLKGDRPGVFLSIHANALPASRATRGFETYFLSEARTDDERRVAALENAVDRPSLDPAPEQTELSQILGELRNLDHQHWSAFLAEVVQIHLEDVHPGRNRGVKQGPFAVITNALMPAVLIEVGYLTHAAEERLLGRPEFHETVAGALAAAVQRFFEQYPTASSTVATPVGP
ncbi:MAG: N-acetylmuramoyl-L-alanine amidase [Gemmatimonadota bacterium]